MKKYLRSLIALLAIALTFSGCGNAAPAQKPSAASSSAVSSAENTSSSAASSYESTSSSNTASSSERASSAAASIQPVGDVTIFPEPETSSDGNEDRSSLSPSSKKVPDEHGVYDSAQDVADYLLYYHKLPENYMTKKEARKLGWESGALNRVVPGKCIGGDVYSNFEGTLPENKTYHECDIGTLNSKNRGAKRLVWSNDFKIYYTKDHYETFTLIGEEK